MIRVQLTFFILLLPIKNPPRGAGQKCKRPHEAAFCEKRGARRPHVRILHEKQHRRTIRNDRQRPGITILDSRHLVLAMPFQIAD